TSPLAPGWLAAWPVGWAPATPATRTMAATTPATTPIQIRIQLRMPRCLPATRPAGKRPPWLAMGFKPPRPELRTPPQQQGRYRDRCQLPHAGFVPERPLHAVRRCGDRPARIVLRPVQHRLDLL